MPVALTEEQAALAEAIHAWSAAHHPRRRCGRRKPVPPQAFPPASPGSACSASRCPPRPGGAGGSIADLPPGSPRRPKNWCRDRCSAPRSAGCCSPPCPKPRSCSRPSPRARRRSRCCWTSCVDGVFRAGARLSTPDTWLLVPVDGGHVLLAPGTPGVEIEPLAPFDFSRPLGARPPLRRRPRRGPQPAAGGRASPATLAAAEAAGVARRCLTVAVEYAKVREQFGKPIGAFQAIKHLCAEMLCRAEAAAALAWDAACAARDRAVGGERGRLSPSTRPSPTPRTASRCSAGSGSPGSTTRTSTCAGPSRCGSGSAGRQRGGAGRLAGSRREPNALSASTSGTIRRCVRRWRGSPRCPRAVATRRAG